MSSWLNILVLLFCHDKRTNFCLSHKDSFSFPSNLTSQFIKLKELKNLTYTHVMFQIILLNIVHAFNSRWEMTHMIAAFDNLFKQVVLGADERWVASKEDEQHHTTAPHVHWFTVGLPLHHLRGHVLRRTDTTWNDCVMFTWTVEELETQDFPLSLLISRII